MGGGGNALSADRGGPLTGREKSGEQVEAINEFEIYQTAGVDEKGAAHVLSEKGVELSVRKRGGGLRGELFGVDAKHPRECARGERAGGDAALVGID